MDIYGETPLFEAAHNGHLDVVEVSDLNFGNHAGIFRSRLFFRLFAILDL